MQGKDAVVASPATKRIGTSLLSCSHVTLASPHASPDRKEFTSSFPTNKEKAKKEEPSARGQERPTIDLDTDHQTPVNLRPRATASPMMFRHVVPALALLAAVTLSEAQFRCPEPKGFFADPEQCDLYYVCVDGKAEEKLCKDGLVFRDDNPKKEHCDLPANVPCGDRTLLQEPQPTKGCPRANGYFRHEDPNACDRFVNCIDGVAQIMPCPPSLVYEDKMSSCVWPADASRLCENAKRDVLDDGFVCPDGDVAGPLGRILPHPTYPHPEDCAKFYICKNGVVPQKGQCDPGTVYDEESFRCTEPENVPGCEDYYKNKN